MSMLSGMQFIGMDDAMFPDMQPIGTYNVNVV